MSCTIRPTTVGQNLSFVDKALNAEKPTFDPCDCTLLPDARAHKPRLVNNGLQL